ncbi:hypothetical protein [Dactylosporangium sp. CS-033363]|uniref:hypothetical protein n=1 Tax=Dactylosporangium sp. CS-033363 TaxID=3239935 RepID=UPI003D8FF279
MPAAGAVGAADGPTLDRTFTMLARDVAASVAAPIIDRIAAKAPNVRLRFLSETSRRGKLTGPIGEILAAHGAERFRAGHRGPP